MLQRPKKTVLSHLLTNAVSGIDYVTLDVDCEPGAPWCLLGRVSETGLTTNHWQPTVLQSPESELVSIDEQISLRHFLSAPF